ncbi:hypothetical protein L1887_17976 [Cichorium endivia]|nr:hypothetical protein L1887_17976 [Cichorium endivia]
MEMKVDMVNEIQNNELLVLSETINMDVDSGIDVIGIGAAQQMDVEIEDSKVTRSMENKVNENDIGSIKNKWGFSKECEGGDNSLAHSNEGINSDEEMENASMNVAAPRRSVRNIIKEDDEGYGFLFLESAQTVVGGVGVNSNVMDCWAAMYSSLIYDENRRYLICYNMKNCEMLLFDGRKKSWVGWKTV